MIYEQHVRLISEFFDSQLDTAIYSEEENTDGKTFRNSSA